MLKKLLKYLLILVILICLLGAWQVYSELQKSASEDPRVWEEDIAALEEGSAPPGAVLFMGSSSIRLWQTLAQDMQPLATVNRGFGGAKLADAVFYADRLVAIDDLAAIVIFVGTNDIHPGASKEPAVLLRSYQQLVARIRTRHAHIPIYYIAITPSLMRWQVWPVAQETNRLIKAYTDSQPGLEFIDTGPGLMKNGQPAKGYYVLDGLHLNASGYRVWTQVIRPRLLEDIPRR